MASLMEELIQTLDAEEKCYSQLIPIEEEKTRAIIANDLEALQDITVREHDLVDETSALENKRERVAIDIATVLGRDPKTITLEQIASVLKNQPADQKKLQEVHDRLRRTVSRLQELNNQNKQLLKEADVEVVHVLTPNLEHADISIAALYAGKHVMCEKPMAKTASDAKRMLEAARETGKKLTIGYQHRQKAQSIVSKAFIERGDLGEIYQANCLAVRRRGTPNWGVFLNEEEQGGGPVIDIATHSLDLTLYLMNNYEPEMVIGKTHKKIEHPEAGNIWGDNGVSTTPLEDSACAFIRMMRVCTRPSFEA